MIINYSNADVCSALTTIFCMQVDWEILSDTVMAWLSFITVKRKNIAYKVRQYKIAGDLCTFVQWCVCRKITCAPKYNYCTLLTYRPTLGSYRKLKIILCVFDRVVRCLLYKSGTFGYCLTYLQIKSLSSFRVRKKLIVFIF